METLRELFISLGLSVNAAEFAEGLAWEHALEKGADLVKEAFEKMGDYFVEAVEKTAEFGEKMELLSIKTGASAEEIQKLGYAASLNGSSAEEMGTALQRLARTMEQAKDGSKESLKHFTKLGISMEEIKHQTPDEMFKTIADKLKALGDHGKASASAMEIFGRQGKNLVPTLLEGREGLEEMGQELDDLGGLLEDKSVHAAREFEDSLKKLHAVADGISHTIGSLLIEAIQPLVTDVLNWVKANQKLIKTKLVEWMTMLGKVLHFVGGAALGVVSIVGVLIDNMKALAIVLGGVVLAALIVANGGLLQMLVNLALNGAAYIAYAAVSTYAALSTAAAWVAAAAPILGIAAALILAALAAEDFYYFVTGGDSALGDFLDEYGEKITNFIDDFLKPKSTDSWLTTMLKDIAHWLTNIGETWDRIKGFAEFLAYGGDKAHHVKGAWEGPSSDEIADGAAEQAQRIRTTQAIYGGGGSPGASAALAQSGANYVHAPTFSGHVTIVQGPGQSAGAVADATTGQFEDWWNSKMREAAPVAGVAGTASR